MAEEVYANGNAIAGKAGGGKVIAAFPDVCLSPPSPPAGPIPIPYPDTSFSKDMQNGTKTVMIGGKEVMLKNQSFYKTSPLGDEAATRGLGAGVITHVITGKTYFSAWSMDVRFEGLNVDRHIDLTTSNHASYPGNSAPMTNMEKMALDRIAAQRCPCCNGPEHATGTPMNMFEWYEQNNPGREEEVRKLLWKAQYRPGCTCKKPTKLLPEAPCDVFFVTNADQRREINRQWNDARPAYQKQHGVISMENQEALFRRDNKRDWTDAERQDIQRRKVQVNHLTPKGAGGCPTAPGNLQPMKDLCRTCQDIDGEFNEFQQIR